MKLKASATKDQVDAFEAAGKAMVGQIPGTTIIDRHISEMYIRFELIYCISGLKSFKFGPVHVPTAQRAKGYQIGVVAILEKPEDLPGYAAHASHQV